MHDLAIYVIAGSGAVIATALIFIGWRLDCIWYELMTWTSTLSVGELPKGK